MKKPSKSGPVAVIENKGVRIPIYLSPRRGEESYLIAYYANGARKRERLPTLDAAKTQARKKVEELASGTVHIGTYSAAETAAIESAISILAPTGWSLTQAAREVADGLNILEGRGSIVEACRFFIKQEKLREISPIKLRDLITKFLNSIKQESSFRHWQDCCSRLGGLAHDLGERNIMDIRAKDLTDYLQNVRRRVWVVKEGVRRMNFIGKAKPVTGRNRDNYIGVFRTLFNYARANDYLPRDVDTEADYLKKGRKTGGDIEIYTPEELLQILTNLDSKWIPFAAIAAFGGARSAEIHRLDWEEIKLDEDHITIAKEKSKTNARRIIPILPCLAAWLKPHAQKSGPVTPRFSQDAALLANFRKSFNKSGVTSKHNGFRHSFASYRVAMTQNMGQVALEMGTSERKITTNYKTPVTAKVAEEWFSIFPPSAKNSSPSRKGVAKKSSPNLRTVKKSVLAKA